MVHSQKKKQGELTKYGGTPIHRLYTNPAPKNPKGGGGTKPKYKTVVVGHSVRPVTRIPLDDSTRTQPKRKATNTPAIRKQAQAMVTPSPTPVSKHRYTFTETPTKKYTPASAAFQENQPIRKRKLLSPRQPQQPPVSMPSPEIVTRRLPSPKYGAGAYKGPKLQSATKLNMRLSEARKQVKNQSSVTSAINKRTKKKPTTGGGGGGGKPRTDRTVSISSPKHKVIAKNKQGKTVPLRNLYSSPKELRESTQLSTLESLYF